MQTRKAASTLYHHSAKSIYIYFTLFLNNPLKMTLYKQNLQIENRIETIFYHLMHNLVGLGLKKTRF